MRQPNSEQRKAIEHFGGVLLKAGAGSGKTFVLVEHIIYLTKKFLFNDEENLKEQDQEVVLLTLKKYYSAIVLMTFTNKAAGELLIRLKKRLQYEEEQASCKYEFNPWSLSIEAISQMTIGTIHGFCFKLIKQGFFPHISPDATIVTDTQFETYIEESFEEWLGINQSSSDLLDIIRSNSSQILSAMKNIFKDPSLRLSWEQTGENLKADEDLFEDIYQLSSFNGVYTDEINLNELDEYKKNKWYQFLEIFLELRQTRIKDYDSFNKFDLFFKEMSRMPPSPRKNLGLVEINKYFDKIKEFKKFFFDKSSRENFILYFENKNGVIQEWRKELQGLFDYLNKEYAKFNGLTFSDLEYHVLKGVRELEICSKISSNYQYFIIDEFQDTSYIQFEIIQKLIKDDYSRLFCVGDEKQAIYGFRGGELGVFWECQDKINQVLTLKNNYRSLNEIIHFNNALFDGIFKKGLNYDGEDLMAVDVIYQEAPLDYEKTGEVTQRLCELELEDEKVLTEDIYSIEAFRIFEYLKQSQSKEICILYKNLRPSSVLIELLIKEKMSFTAQIKIPFEEEPLIGIFYTLLGCLLNSKENKDVFAHFVIESYLKILNVENCPQLKERISNFFVNMNYLGLIPSFNKFLFDLGLSNSNSVNNISFLNDLVNTTTNSEELYLKLKQMGGQKFSMDFKFGENPDSIIIMTAHSSKGLEFEEIILAGIQTNATRAINVDLFGKLPGSFRWYLSSNKKKSFKSLIYIYEGLLNKHKEFAESKRLFYVASTRAQEKITWFDFYDEQGSRFNQKNSWGNGFEFWEGSNKELFSSIIEDKINLKKLKQELSHLNTETPLFHKHEMGIVKKNKENEKLGIISEISVTRLATLAECGRKFYLQNILKITEGEKENLPDLIDDSEETLFFSSAERGSKVHEMISNAIKNNWIIERKDFQNKYTPPVNWALEKLKPLRGSSTFISEETIKFPFFGHVITGIPDLVILSDDSSQVWDFKTGSPNEKKNIGYLFQLKAYAYALYKLDKVSKENSVKLVLCYVDTEELLEISTNYQQLVEDLYPIWQRVTDFNHKGEEFCSGCGFYNLCYFNS